MMRIDHTQEAERLMEKAPVVKKSLNIPRSSFSAAFEDVMF